jgi:hypothetical protein
MTKKQIKLEHAISDLWRSHPEYLGTFSACSTPKCVGSGGGGGPCASCCVATIERLTGLPLMAMRLRRAIKDIRFITNELREHVK